ncbi:uncharacterized protein LOC129004448 [Macrosteles quadrilineatus]|uniref:uncharacterized protein LOC129004448 n=1 Tax=Macrosteles quadrilineatus TaxID=74068 RepID=UPI0023E0B5AB|nr:uncharacterized protein LOC129004448 [Macrosteles quadrilineatus]XP_054289028.1 uncharacterized protein LOC129004448 [Macrosteles quadrilineatus]XP_054289033.1 uncharacterized protein LOC129004448 [Macrosteles quadrilineatus]XP_054289042.1 uncharacterized protein LOC129004448 [Macrosteles quadrilineatus]
MGDEGTSEKCRQLSNLQPRIIIRKCKKPSKDSVLNLKSDSKKVNGELESDDKNEINNEVIINKSNTKQVNEESNAKQVNEERKRKAIVLDSEEDCSIIEADSTSDNNTHDGDNEDKELPLSVEFKGFKKRIIARTEKSKDDSSESSLNSSQNEILIQEPVKIATKVKQAKASRGKKNNNHNGKKNNDVDGEESQAESQAEYAQYLGLQPTMQFKCYRCGEKGFPSMLALNMHQRGCGLSHKSNFLANLQQDTTHMTSSDPNMLTNFRITRKVYLCSACGTYYENWNLFLHMREVHKKHICLYCLTMFTVANKLADHLQVAHSAQENSCKTVEEFQNTYIGSCYLICCSCENMFTEREDFFNHDCPIKDPTAKCPICGVKCGHYYTCPNSNLPLSSPIPVNISPTSSAGKPQVPNTAKTVTKNKTSDECWVNKKNLGGLSSDNDDDYDISHAASFCHVDLADESGEKSKIDLEDNVIDITDDEPSNEIDQGSETKEEASTDFNPNKTDSMDNEVGNHDPSLTCEEKEEERLNPLEPESGAHDESSAGKEGNSDIPPEIHDKNQPTGANETGNAIEGLTVDKTNIALEDQPENRGSLLLDEEGKDINENPDLVKNTDDNVDTNSSTEEVLQPVENVQNNQSVKSKGDDLESSSQVEKTDTTTSDSDRDEPSTHQSVSQDDTESSSDSSSDEEEDSKKNNEQLAAKEKEASASESEDSARSGLVVDEKSKPPSHEETPDIDKKNDDDGCETLMETKSVTSNEFTRDFLLDDSSSLEKHIEKNAAENETVGSEKDEDVLEEVCDGIQLANEDVPAMALTLEDKLEIVSPQAVVKECVRTSCLNCVYCSHAVKIAVNGKQLALHLLREHRYKPIKNNETSQDVIKKLKSSLLDLEDVYFNTEFYDSSEKPLNTTYEHTYECFQCRFVSKVHKELFNHKRKMHPKSILQCVMCKTNFFSYSELLCHMCPGIYVPGVINFRCCFCNLDMIPSAFRLMVHLRKSHHTCDICLEMAGDQQKLSSHMWKHKLNHMCYRCEIAYRNKPDITKHLFWKHGTESVLCKKCLQKKWPHVYHFCVPPTVFICEECNASFTKAVALKVHKRFHGGELPYGCSKCEFKFVSKKLLAKHEDTHNQPPPSENLTNNSGPESKMDKSLEEHINVETIDEPVRGNASEECMSKIISNDNEENSESQTLKSKKKKKKDRDRKGKPVVDVYNLPPLNLSSESDSSDEETKTATSESAKETPPTHEFEVHSTISGENPDKQITSPCENVEASEESQTPVPIVDGVWDNFHSYKAELEKRESKDLSLPNILPSTSSFDSQVEASKTPEPEPKSDWFLLDHSYCLIPGRNKPSETEDQPTISEPAPIDEKTEKPLDETPAPRGHSSSIDHAYATTNNTSADSPSINNVVPKELSLGERPSTPPPQVMAISELNSSPKKKLKTPKKKKHTENSSSSSDSSSDSDSSSCSCGPDCSCSNTSSSSSSSSSDSESSTSEGRQKTADRREKKKEKLKHKHHKEEEQVPEVTHTLPVEEEPVVDVPVEPMELPIQESDLDTDESSTDEDFYDKCPQTHGKQQLENRNKLLFLASVAPVNNGTVSPPPPQQSLPPPPAPPVEENPSLPPASAKRKVKTKRRRKSQQVKKQTSKVNAQPHQLLHPITMDLPVATSTPSHVTNHQNITSKFSLPSRSSIASFQSDTTAGSGSENESARLSKRKRVRNKFYGYSSEEEEGKPSLKWRKIDTVSATPQISSPQLSLQQSFPSQRTHNTILQERKTKPSDSSGTEEERIVKRDVSSNSSSSSSSESEHEIETKEIVPKEQQTEKSDNLYCYCQCPYDEVSEMIACDGQDCTIEWFHFECVGIMVPPKGKWYCPDCRKRRGLM